MSICAGRAQKKLTLGDSRFRSAVLAVAAPLRGIAKNLLDGEDVRQQRRKRWLARSAVAAVGGAAVVAGWQAYEATQAQRAEARQRKVAEQAAQRAEVQRAEAVFAGAEAENQAIVAQAQQAEAEHQRDEAQRQRQRADERARIALARQLLAQSTLERNREGGGVERGALLALESSRLLPTGEASARVQDALRLLKRPIAALRLTHPPGSGNGTMVFAADGSQVVTVDLHGQITVLDLASGRAQQRDVAFADAKDPAVSRVSPDGRRAALAHRDAGLRVIDVATGDVLVRSPRPQGSMDPHAGGLAFSPDGNTLARVLRRDLPGGQWGYSLQVWDLERPRMLRELDGPGFIGSIEFSADGRRVLGLGTSREGAPLVRQWDTGRAGSAESVKSPAIKDAAVCAFHSDGRHVALTHKPGHSTLEQVSIYDLAEERVVKEIHVRGIPERCLFSPDGHVLAIGTEAGTGIYDGRNGYRRGEFAPGAKALPTVFSADGRRLSTVGFDGTARIWDLETMGEIARVVHPSTERIPHVSHVAFAPDGQRLASFGPDGVLRVVDLGSGAEVSRLSLWHPAHRRPFAIGPWGVAVATLSDYTVHMTDLRTRKPMGQFRHKDHGESRVVAVVDGKRWRLLTAASEYSMQFSGRRPTMRNWNITDGKELAPRIDMPSVAAAFEISSDGTHVATSAPGNNDIHVWRLGQSEPIARLPVDEPSLSLAMAPRGAWMAGAGKALHVWHLSKGQRRRVDLAQGAARLVVASADGQWLAAGFADRTLRIYAARGKFAETARFFHEAEVTDAAFSQDGRFVVTSTPLGHAHVWQIDIGREVARLPHAAPVVSVAFDADGRHIASLSKTATPYRFNAHLWRWRPDDLSAAICERVNRNLTEDEWREHVGREVPYRRICELSSAVGKPGRPDR